MLTSVAKPAFSYSEEQEEYRNSVRGFLNAVSPVGEARRLLDSGSGYESSSWHRACQVLGLGSLQVPESLGGQGFGLGEQAIAMEETGRILSGLPLFSSAVLAAGALMAAGTEAEQRRLLPDLVSGRATAALALAEPVAGWALDSVTASFRETGAGVRLDGLKSPVLEGGGAGLLLVVARLEGSAGGDGLSLLEVRPGPGVTREPLQGLDITRRWAAIRFESAPAIVLGAEGQAATGLASALSGAELAMAAEAVGLAGRCLEMAVEYSCARYQFGRAIGSFQAVKHRCADMLVAVEAARSALHFGLARAHEGGDGLLEGAAVAKAYCVDAALRVASSNIQVHGGIGCTWEHDAHLYLRRARSLGLILESPSAMRRRLASIWAV